MAYPLLHWLEPLLSWRNAFVLYFLFNLKTVPLSWHLRALYYFLRAIPRPSHDAENHRGSAEPAESPLARDPDVLFANATITMRSPLSEADFNMHKSNSTFFSDLDMSRLVLMIRVCFAGFRTCSRELAAAGHSGPMSLTLGSVYCSFKRPVKPYEAYRVTSRVLSWDRKWLYILSWFSRDKGGPGSGDEEVIACALSKYVCKKGRLTIPPERLMRAAGLIPTEGKEGEVQKEEEGGKKEHVEDAKKEHQEDAKEQQHEDIKAQTGALAAEWLSHRELDGVSEPTCRSEAKQDADHASEKQGTRYKAIEAERLRGLQVAKDFIGLDDVASCEVVRMLTCRGTPFESRTEGPGLAGHVPS